MAGKIKEMLDKVIQIRSKGDLGLANLTKAKFILKGVNPDKFNPASPDDIGTIERIKIMAKDFGVQI